MLVTPAQSKSNPTPEGRHVCRWCGEADFLYLAANHSRVWNLRAAGFPLGWIMSPKGWRRPERVGHPPMPFAIDNGLFHPICREPKGMKALPAFYGMLEKIAVAGYSPLFVVVPDAPYDAEQTRRLFPKHLRHVREILPGVRVAMAVQDGMTADDVLRIEPPGAVFVGGSTEWKWATVADWMRVAKERGLWAHVARVNTHRRIRRCMDIEADSADGTGFFRGDKLQLRKSMEALADGMLWRPSA